MTIRAILFDKDGTFVDFDKTWGPAAFRVMDRIARGDRGKIERLMQVSDFDEAGMRFRPTSPLVAGSSADYGPLWAEAIGVPFSKAVTDEMDVLFVEEGLAGLTPIGDPAGAIGGLKARGLVLGVVTNDSENGARSQTARLGIDHHFDFIVGWDSGHGRKPAPGQIHAFLDAWSMAPHEVAMIGDSLHDMHAARAAGVVAVGVTTGPLVPADFALHADVVLPSFMDVADWLDRRA
ncbi:MAG: HAD-IA family hydrolase [Phreatobacter sp.]|uniref:HAD family hydrolase n=1 Tax=Phreatobacter sp. TaxID=1966341 RepID=UPI0027362C2A|nr:HAD-IA family hydrolase [Phreatobacter sp.]MDP2801841.1 HAD-IA family hydrolase [Phreatobacter sp.]